MADVDTIIAAGCSTGIGNETNLITLLQITAQNLANALPDGTDISVGAIIARAKESGIGCEENPVTLLQIIAQLLHEASGGET